MEVIGLRKGLTLECRVIYPMTIIAAAPARRSTSATATEVAETGLNGGSVQANAAVVGVGTTKRVKNRGRKHAWLRPRASVRCTRGYGCELGGLS